MRRLASTHPSRLGPLSCRCRSRPATCDWLQSPGRGWTFNCIPHRQLRGDVSCLLTHHLRPLLCASSAGGLLCNRPASASLCVPHQHPRLPRYPSGWSVGRSPFFSPHPPHSLYLPHGQVRREPGEYLSRCRVPSSRGCPGLCGKTSIKIPSTARISLLHAPLYSTRLLQSPDNSRIEPRAQVRTCPPNIPLPRLLGRVYATSWPQQKRAVSGGERSLSLPTILVSAGLSVHLFPFSSPD